MIIKTPFSIATSGKVSNETDLEKSICGCYLVKIGTNEWVLLGNLAA